MASSGLVLVIATATPIGAALASHVHSQYGARQVSQGSLFSGAQLGYYLHQGSERGMTTPAGEACTKTTTGVIVPAPVSIVGRKATGKESHRLTERQTGLPPVAGETQVFAQTKPAQPPAAVAPPRPCQKPGCPDLVTGRRLWCQRHAQASSILKRRWRTAGITSSGQAS